MKRILIGIVSLFLVGTASYSLENRSFMVKLDIMGGEIDTDTAKGTEDLDAELGLGLEYLLRWENGIDTGIGFSFERHELSGSRFDYGFNRIESYPLYGILRYRLKTKSNWTPYIYGNLGYAFTSESKAGISIDDGIYYGAGLGVEYVENLGIQIGWSRTEFDGRDRGGNSFDPESDLIKLSIIMRLDH